MAGSESENISNNKNGEGVFVSFSSTVVANVIAVLVVGGLSLLFAQFVRLEIFENTVSMLLWIIALVVWTLISYLMFLALQYLFRDKFVIHRSLDTHASLIFLLLLIVFSTSAGNLLYQIHIDSNLHTKFQSVTEEIDKITSQWEEADKRTLRLYRLAADSIRDILALGTIGESELKDILSHCIESLRISLGKTRNVRTTVVFLDSSQRYLVMPKHGFYGTGYDSDIQKLYFDISPKNESEKQKEFLNRIGVAGWAYLNNKEVVDEDVQNKESNEKYRYKFFPASEKDQADRAMMCVPIKRILKDSKQIIGILSVSSTTAGEFTDGEKAVIRFFATLLSLYDAPIETPIWLEKHG